jgi:dTDP-4-amino-4,6-dideoxygalactose transaminase
MIPVSQPFLPPKDEYTQLLSEIWESKWLTNNGAFVRRLEQEIESYLNVSSLSYVSNGTIALQLALKSLEIKNEVITTPFSFVATTSSILWQNCRPVFVDIDQSTLCIDANKIEEAITHNTAAILATHVFGIPCDVEKIERIAKKYNIKVIYDGAHAFGVRYKGRSLLTYGDISTISFHATKLFHTVEGGAIINNQGAELDRKIRLLRSFGFKDDEHFTVGINGKNSEFHAAMGLCNLKYIGKIIEKRKKLTQRYNELLDNRFERPTLPDNIEYNYAYYPVIFDKEKELLCVQSKLRENGIETRRYFYPSLNKLGYLQKQYTCPISEEISKRILCLPLFYELKLKDVEKIADMLIGNEVLEQL